MGDVMDLKAKSKKNKSQKQHDIKLVVVTLLVAGIIGGLVFYHFQSLQVAEKRGYLEGSAKTLQSIKSILAK